MGSLPVGNIVLVPSGAGKDHFLELSFAEKICEYADYIPYIETADTGDFVTFKAGQTYETGYMNLPRCRAITREFRD